MRTLFSVVLLLLTVPRAYTQATSPAQADESRILTLELAWNHAVQEKDTKALEMLIAPEMVYIEIDGTLMNRAEYLASVASRSVHAEQILYESMTVHLYSPIAIVSGVYRESGAKDGKPYTHRERFIDTWVLRGGNWLCVASQSTLIAR
ncbi:MAG TPA: nuclear transport factor 2 family protein [Candidatus Sulfotelmatobacter sp.]|nr:nuclear transport factor 2 family protein [Candidatus Sulfotelmatobacter sp.]